MGLQSLQGGIHSVSIHLNFSKEILPSAQCLFDHLPDALRNHQFRALNTVFSRQAKNASTSSSEGLPAQHTTDES